MKVGYCDKQPHSLLPSLSEEECDLKCSQATDVMGVAGKVAISGEKRSCCQGKQGGRVFPLATCSLLPGLPANFLMWMNGMLLLCNLRHQVDLHLSLLAEQVWSPSLVTSQRKTRLCAGLSSPPFFAGDDHTCTCFRRNLPTREKQDNPPLFRI